jgi:hypothetical protein
LDVANKDEKDSGCLQTFPRRSLADHMNQCPQVMVDCPFREHGCVRLLRGDLNNHLAKSNLSHLLLLSARCTQLVAQCNQLTGKLEDATRHEAHLTVMLTEEQSARCHLERLLLARSCTAEAQSSSILAASPQSLMLIGGSVRGSPSAKCWQLDVADVKAKWVSLPDMIFPRSSHAAAIVAGLVCVIGGKSTGGCRLKTAECYNPVTNCWKAMTSLPSPRSGCVAVTCSGRLYLIGGHGDDGCALTTILVWDPCTDKWTERGKMSAPRTHAAAVAVGQRIWIFGGSSSLKTRATTSTECWDPARACSVVGPPMPTPRKAATAVLMLTGDICIFGGEKKAAGLVDCFRPCSNLWQTLDTQIPDTQQRGVFGTLLGSTLCVSGNSSVPKALTSCGESKQTTSTVEKKIVLRQENASSDESVQSRMRCVQVRFHQKHLREISKDTWQHLNCLLPQDCLYARLLYLP